MEEKIIQKVAIITTIIGLVFLFFYADNFSLAAVGDIENVGIEEDVHLRGQINSLRVTEKATFMEVEGERIVKTDVILFPEESLYLREGDYVEIFGEVEEYNGEKEVIGSKIVLK